MTLPHSNGRLCTSQKSEQYLGMIGVMLARKIPDRFVLHTIIGLLLTQMVGAYSKTFATEPAFSWLRRKHLMSSRNVSSRNEQALSGIQLSKYFVFVRLQI